MYNLSGALQILNGKRRETERELRTETDAEDEVRTDLQRRSVTWSGICSVWKPSIKKEGTPG